jgi:hypothetical protein
MATTPFLNIIPFASGQAFQPETIEAMGIAYEKVCESLKLVERSGQGRARMCSNILKSRVSSVDESNATV